MGLQLTMTCGPYDRAKALIDGEVKPEGVDLKIYVNTENPESRTEGPEEKFDIVEFSTGTYIADLPFQTLGYTAIPIFVKRMFRHSYIYINKRVGIRSPKDLNNKRVGISGNFASAAIWDRGILQDEWGVDIESITWVASQDARVGNWKPPAWLKLEIAPKGTNQKELLASGAVAAALNVQAWAPGIHPDIDFLFPNYADIERDYFKRTGFCPIIHTLLIKREVLENHPWVAMSLFNAWLESKERCYKWLEWQRVNMTSLWFRALFEEERAVAGRDIYRWGLSDTRAEVDKLLEYAYRQGVTARRFAPEDMFHPSTLNT